MSLSTQNRSRKRKKSLGQKQEPKKLSYSERHELTDLCNRVAEIAEQAGRPESMVIMEAALIHLMRHLDKPSRDALFESVDIILDAKAYAEQQNIINQKILDTLRDKKGDLQMGVIAQHVTDIILERTTKFNIDENVRNNIIKVIVTRLALELNHKTLQEVATLLLPNALEKKEQNAMRYMYG